MSASSSALSSKSAHCAITKAKERPSATTGGKFVVGYRFVDADAANRNNEGTIDAPLARHPVRRMLRTVIPPGDLRCAQGLSRFVAAVRSAAARLIYFIAKRAVTHYKVLERFGRGTHFGPTPTPHKETHLPPNPFLSAFLFFAENRNLTYIPFFFLWSLLSYSLLSRGE
jgi:hypothetical protein